MNLPDKVEQLDKDTNDYTKKVTSEFESSLHEGQKPFQDLLDYLRRYHFFFSFLMDEKFPKQVKVIEPLMVIYSKVAQSLFGVCVCLQNGLSSDALVIVRTIFESLLTVEIISQENPYERLKLYGEFKYVSEWKELQACLKLVEKGEMELAELESYYRPDEITSIEDAYEKVKDNYHPQNPFHWAWKLFKDDPELNRRNPTVKYLCSKLSREYYYVQLYASASKLVHNDPDIEQYVKIDCFITPTLNFSPTILVIGELALQFCGELINHVVDFLDLPEKKIIKDWNINFITEACRQIPPPAEV
jgi:hypothetical protein